MHDFLIVGWEGRLARMTHQRNSCRDDFGGDDCADAHDRSPAVRGWASRHSEEMRGETLRLGRKSGAGSAPLVEIRPLLGPGTGVVDDRGSWIGRVAWAGPSHLHVDMGWVLTQT